jgi:hypothetical protein
MPPASHETAEKSNGGPAEGPDQLLRQLSADETNGRSDETESLAPRRQAETERSYHPIDIEFRGHIMSSKLSVAKYLLVRTAAFIGLTAASTAVMALPYLG